MAKLSMEVGNEIHAQAARSFLEERGGHFYPLYGDGLLHVITEISGDDYIILHNLLRQNLLAEIRFWFSGEPVQVIVVTNEQSP
jgi:hypothetical protein